MFAEVANVRDRLLLMTTGTGDGVERERYAMTSEEVAAAVDAYGPLQDPPAHPSGSPASTPPNGRSTPSASIASRASNADMGRKAGYGRGRAASSHLQDTSPALNYIDAGSATSERFDAFYLIR